MKVRLVRGGNLDRLLATLIHHGRALRKHVSWRPRSSAAAADPVSRLKLMCDRLLSGLGEASGTSLALDILRGYSELIEADKLTFFQCLAEFFGPDWNAARAAWTAHEQQPSTDAFRRLLKALEPPRQELFRRLNYAPGGTETLVGLREDLVKAIAANPVLSPVDDDLAHLLQSWFNRGFLVMQKIDWSTPADLLERIIRYEAVHQIGDWEELRRRLLPADRRCYAFFHPAMADDPLIFVQVALTDAIPDSIQQVLDKDRMPASAESATTAVFYSISNCQPGLRGVSFGNFLIKQVVEELSRELPGLSTFVTLSPVPAFRRWLLQSDAIGTCAGAGPEDWTLDVASVIGAKSIMMPLAAQYFLTARDQMGRPIDPVARFHLGNGARLERLCYLGDMSAKGMAESAGLMVNYLYELPQLEANHEAFANNGHVVASDAVSSLLRIQDASKGARSHHVG